MECVHLHISGVFKIIQFSDIKNTSEKLETNMNSVDLLLININCFYNQDEKKTIIDVSMEMWNKKIYLQ